MTTVYSRVLSDSIYNIFQLPFLLIREIVDLSYKTSVLVRETH